MKIWTFLICWICFLQGLYAVDPDLKLGSSHGVKHVELKVDVPPSILTAKQDRLESALALALELSQDNIQVIKIASCAAGLGSAIGVDVSNLSNNTSLSAEFERIQSNGQLIRNLQQQSIPATSFYPQFISGDCLNASTRAAFLVRNSHPTNSSTILSVFRAALMNEFGITPSFVNLTRVSSTSEVLELDISSSSETVSKSVMWNLLTSASDGSLLLALKEANVISISVIPISSRALSPSDKVKTDASGSIHDAFPPFKIKLNSDGNAQITTRNSAQITLDTK